MLRHQGAHLGLRRRSRVTPTKKADMEYFELRGTTCRGDAQVVVVRQASAGLREMNAAGTPSVARLMTERGRRALL